MPSDFIVRVDGQDYLARNGALIKSDGGLVNIGDALAWAPIIQNDTGADDSDKSFTVTAGKDWMIQSVRATLVSDSSTGVRQLAIQIQGTSTGVVTNDYVPGLTQAASLTHNYNFGPGRPDSTALRDSTHVQTPIEPLVLRPGAKIRVFDNNAVSATGDDLSVRLMVLERPSVVST